MQEGSEEDPGRYAPLGELDHELGLEAETSPLPGWSPYKFETSLSLLLPGGTLAGSPVGRTIQITTRRAETWIATVIEVIEHRDDFVLVRNSGNG